MGPHLDLGVVSSLKSSLSIFGLLRYNFAYSDYSSYYFSPIRVKEIETYSTFLSVNSYLRNEIPLLNSRVRKSYNFFMSNFRFFGVGVGSSYFTYPVRLISNNTNSLFNLLNGKSYISKMFLSSTLNLVIFYKFNLTFYFNKFFKAMFNPLTIKIDDSVTSLISAHLGFNNDYSDYVFSPVFSIGLNTDINYFSTIYQGHHGAYNTLSSYVVMPTALFCEKGANFLNLEGILQKSHAAISPDALIKKDDEIFKALNELNSLLGLTPSYLLFKKFYFFLNLDSTVSLSLPS